MKQKESRRQFVDNQEVQSMSAPVQVGLTPAIVEEINQRRVETFNNIEKLVQEVRLCQTLNDYPKCLPTSKQTH